MNSVLRWVSFCLSKFSVNVWFEISVHINMNIISGDERSVIVSVCFASTWNNIKPNTNDSLCTLENMFTVKSIDQHRKRNCVTIFDNNKTAEKYLVSNHNGSLCGSLRLRFINKKPKENKLKSNNELTKCASIGISWCWLPSSLMESDNSSFGSLNLMGGMLISSSYIINRKSIKKLISMANKIVNSSISFNVWFSASSDTFTVVETTSTSLPSGTSSYTKFCFGFKKKRILTNFCTSS